MLFMVIEKFRNQLAKPAYQRFRDEGRLLPEGVNFCGSWVSADLNTCFQLMEAESITQIQEWVARWQDLVVFEIVPVVTGSETAEALAGQLPPKEEL